MPKGSPASRIAAVDHTERPVKKSSPNRRLILGLRRTRQLGIKQLRNELLRNHGLRLSLDTLHRVLAKHAQSRAPTNRAQGTKRYSRPVPGDRVQMDVCKIAPALYQYTAIDDCSRWKVMGLFPRRTAASTRRFLDRLLEEVRFPVHASGPTGASSSSPKAVQRRLMAWAIKFQPIKSRSPHLNGKVERTQRADREEFWATANPKIARPAATARRVAALLELAPTSHRPRWTITD
jgi:transposase-like protein